MAGPKIAGSITLDAAQFEAAMGRVKALGGSVAGQLTNQFKSLAGPLAALAPAIAAAFTGAAIARGVAQVFEGGRALQQMSRATGSSVQGLVILGAKFKQAGLDSDAVSTAIFRLQKSLNGVEDEENKGGTDRLSKLGLNLAQIKRLAPDQQLFAVGRAIASIQDPSERTAAAMQIFGRAGGQLGAVFGMAGFSQVAPGLEAKAQMLARNAAIFEQVSIKLEKVGNILKTFYAGVADRVVHTLAPILDRLETINLVAAGQKFGDALTAGAQLFIGLFQRPELIGNLLANGAEYGFRQAGNILVAVLTNAGVFFKNNFVSIFEVISQTISAVLLKAFTAPIAYLQAGIESSIQYSQYIDDKTHGKKDDPLGGMSEETRRKQIEGTNKIIANAEAGHGNYESLKQAKEYRKQLRNYDPSKYAHVPEDFSSIYNRRLKEPVRMGITGEGSTAEEHLATAKKQAENLANSFEAQFSTMSVDDVFGANKSGVATDLVAKQIQHAGYMALHPAPEELQFPNLPPASTDNRAETGPSRAPRYLARPSSYAPNGRPETIVPKIPMGAFMDMLRAPVVQLMPALGMAVASIASVYHPTTDDQYGDARRRSDMLAFHTVGNSSALDDHDTSLRTGGLGGGAYGQTGNIWKQISGYGPGGPNAKTGVEKSNDLLEKIKSLTEDNFNLQQQLWMGKGGGTGSGKGGPTTTK